MTNILFRNAELAPSEGRRLFGVAVPYNTVAVVADADGQPYREKFVHGAFRRSIAERSHKLRLFTSHDTRRLPIGKPTELREESNGLHVEFDVARTTAGDDALELVRSGLVTSFSIGFHGLRHHMDNGVVVRTEASLREISLVPEPAYADAVVGGVRSSQFISRAVAQARLDLLDW